MHFAWAMVMIVHPLLAQTQCVVDDAAWIECSHSSLTRVPSFRKAKTGKCSQKNLPYCSLHEGPVQKGELPPFNALASR